MPRARDVWTAGEIELVRSLLAQGVTRSQIGAQLGRSRCAVSGQIHRGGLSSAAAPATAIRAGTTSLRARGHRAEVTRPRPIKPRSVSADTEVMLKPGTMRGRSPAVLVPICEPVSLLDLGPGGCHWPVAGGSGLSLMMCGAPLARQADGIYAAPFEQGEIGPDLFAAERVKDSFT
jgi:hypothetical protein